MKTKSLYLISIGFLLLALGFFIYIYFSASKFDPENTEFTINVNKKEFQPIYLDNVFGTTKLVAAKVTEISDVDSTGMAKIEEMFVKTIRLSGASSSEVYFAQFDGETMHLFFVPGKTGKEVKVKLPKNGISFNTEVNAEILTIGHNLSDLLKDRDLMTKCSDYFDENGLIKNQPLLIDGDCLSMLNEAGRICNGNCVHE